MVPRCPTWLQFKTDEVKILNIYVCFDCGIIFSFRAVALHTNPYGTEDEVKILLGVNSVALWVYCG